DHQHSHRSRFQNALGGLGHASPSFPRATPAIKTWNGKRESPALLSLIGATVYGLDFAGLLLFAGMAQASSTQVAVKNTLHRAEHFLSQHRVEKRIQATYGYFTSHPVAPLN